MKIKEIMIRTVVTVNKHSTIKECGDLLEKHDINGAPVMDDGRVVGVITRADIFRSILLRYPDLHGNERHLMDFNYIEERIHKVHEMKVSDLMGSPAITLDQETLCSKAGSIMILRKIKQIPVLNNNVLVGIITMADICRNLLKRADDRVSSKV